MVPSLTPFKKIKYIFKIKCTDLKDFSFSSLHQLNWAGERDNIPHLSGFPVRFLHECFPGFEPGDFCFSKMNMKSAKNSKISSLFLRFGLFQVYFRDKQTGDVEGSCGNPVLQPLIKKSSRSVRMILSKYKD